MPCFNNIHSSKGSPLTCLNLSLNGMITEFGKLILFPCKVTLTSFQSNSNTSQIKFLFNVTHSGISVPTNLNKWILPTTLQNFTSTSACASDIKSITLTTLENRCHLNNLNFLTFVVMIKIIPNRTNSTIAIVYHCVLQVQWTSLIISCSNTTSVPFICCQAILVTKDINLACLHTIYETIAETTNDIKAVKKRKNIYCIAIKKEFLLESKLLLLICPFCKSKISL